MVSAQRFTERAEYVEAQAETLRATLQSWEVPSDAMLHPPAEPLAAGYELSKASRALSKAACRTLAIERSSHRPSATYRQRPSTK